MGTHSKGKIQRNKRKRWHGQSN